MSNLLQSRLGFFSSGFMIAVLNASGQTPVTKDELIISRTVEEILLKTFLNRVAGIGSNM